MTLHYCPAEKSPPRAVNNDVCLNLVIQSVIMTKTLLLLCSCLLCGLYVHAQVRESRVSIDTVYRDAFYFETDMGENDTKDAIESYFDSLNISREKGKGFIIKKNLGYMLFRRAKLDYVNDLVDIYFVVNDKKVKTGSASSVYVAASKNNVFIGPESQVRDWNTLKDYVSYLQSNFFEQYQINKEMAALNKDLDKQRKKLQELEKQKLDLENSISTDSSRVAGLLDELYKLRTKKP